MAPKSDLQIGIEKVRAEVLALEQLVLEKGRLLAELIQLQATSPTRKRKQGALAVAGEE